MWQKVTKFKGAEYFRKALYLKYIIEYNWTFLFLHAYLRAARNNADIDNLKSIYKDILEMILFKKKQQ